MTDEELVQTLIKASGATHESEEPMVWDTGNDVNGVDMDVLIIDGRFRKSSLKALFKTKDPAGAGPDVES